MSIHRVSDIFIKSKLSIFALLFAAILSAIVFGQELAATLTGSVTDPTGAVVEGATVVVHSNETNTDVRTVTTDASGNYTVTNLQPGNYTVTVKQAGFQSYVAQNVVLEVAQKRTSTRN